MDRNSPYLYLLWCRDFADTSVVAEVDGDIAGFVTGYRRPADPGTLFVWQVAVGEAWRRQGLALAMLGHLCEQLVPALRFVEASVTPSNHASASLFRSLATAAGAEYASATLFDAAMFPPGCAHDAEVLVRVGPLAGDESRGAVSRDGERPVLA